MSLDQKSKLLAYEKHIQARDDSNSHKSVWAGTVVEKGCSCSSCSLFKGNTKSPSATGTSSTSQGSQRISSTVITSSGTTDTSSGKGDKSQNEKRSSSFEVSSKNSRRDSLPMKVDLLEYFLLYKYKMKQPILKKDMLKIVGRRNQDYFADILKKVSERIEVVFAIDVKEVDSSYYSYDLVSKLKLPNNGRVHSGKGWPKTGLLMNILSLIFMNGSCATEEELWKFLNKMKIYAGKKHFIYGEPKKLINIYFVQLKYLEYRQVPNSDPAHYEFLWGPRAHADTSKMRVLEFLAKVGDKALSVFSPWCEEALQDEERTRATDAVSSGISALSSKDFMALASRTSLRIENFLYHQNKNDIVMRIFLEM